MVASISLSQNQLFYSSILFLLMKPIHGADGLPYDLPFPAAVLGSPVESGFATRPTILEYRICYALIYLITYVSESIHRLVYQFDVLGMFFRETAKQS